MQTQAAAGELRPRALVPEVRVPPVGRCWGGVRILVYLKLGSAGKIPNCIFWQNTLKSFSKGNLLEEFKVKFVQKGAGPQGSI